MEADKHHIANYWGSAMMTDPCFCCSAIRAEVKDFNVNFSGKEHSQPNLFER